MENTDPALEDLKKEMQELSRALTALAETHKRYLEFLKLKNTRVIYANLPNIEGDND